MLGKEMDTIKFRNGYRSTAYEAMASRLQTHKKESKKFKENEITDFMLDIQVEAGQSGNKGQGCKGTEQGTREDGHLPSSTVQQIIHCHTQQEYYYNIFSK